MPELTAEQADPAGLMRAALGQQDSDGRAAGVAAREVVLAWIVSLAPEIDPAFAARSLLAGRMQAGGLDRELREVAAWPAARLRALRPARRPVR